MLSCFCILFLTLLTGGQWQVGANPNYNYNNYDEQEEQEAPLLGYQPLEPSVYLEDDGQNMEGPFMRHQPQAEATLMGMSAKKSFSNEDNSLALKKLSLKEPVSHQESRTESENSKSSSEDMKKKIKGKGILKEPVSHQESSTESEDSKSSSDESEDIKKCCKGKAVYRCQCSRHGGSRHRRAFGW